MPALQEQYSTELPLAYRRQTTTRARRLTWSGGTTRNIEWRRHLDLGVAQDGRLIYREVDVRKTDSYVSVADPVTSIFGVGSNLHEAIHDFRQALVDYRDALRHEDHLSPHLNVLLAELLQLAPLPQA
jgi:hypothetical protein